MTGIGRRRRGAFIGAGCIIAVVVGVAVWLLSTGGGLTELTPAEFRHDAAPDLADLRLSEPTSGVAVSRALVGHLEAAFPQRRHPECHQMGEPAGPDRYFCGLTQYADSRILWVTFLVDPHLGRVRLFRAGVLPIAEPQ